MAGIVTIGNIIGFMLRPSTRGYMWLYFLPLVFFTWGWKKVIWLTSFWIWHHMVAIFIIMHDHPWISSGWNELFGHLLPALWFSCCSEAGTHLLSVICWCPTLQLSFTSVTCQPHASFRSSILGTVHLTGHREGCTSLISLHFLNSSPLPVVERLKTQFFKTQFHV